MHRFKNPVQFKTHVIKLIETKTDGWDCDGKLFSKAIHTIYKNPKEMEAVCNYVENIETDLTDSQKRTRMNKFLKKQCQQIENRRRERAC